MRKLKNGCRKPGSCSFYALQRLQHLRSKLFVAILVISVLIPAVLYRYLLGYYQMNARYIHTPNILSFQHREIEKMNYSMSLDSELQSEIVSVQINMKENNLKRNNGTFQQRKLASSIYSDFETISGMIYDIIEAYHQKAPKDLRMGADIDVSCKQNDTEDILCVTPPKPIENVKNPCWFDTYGRFRCLPYFQLIGFSKCASSDLFARICSHPQVLANKGGNSKETKWWPRFRYGIYKYKGQSDSRKQTFDDYLNYFSEAAANITQNNSLITGDGTPSDVWDFVGWPMIPQNKGLSEPVVLTPHLVRHINPRVKMIVILRDPVERLYSDFFSRGGISPMGFHQRVVDTIVRLHTCVQNATFRSCAFSWEYRLAEKARIHIGFYPMYLKEWFRVFSREQFLFLTTEEYSQNMTKNMRRIFRFLEIGNSGFEEKGFSNCSEFTEEIKKDAEQTNLQRRYLNLARNLIGYHGHGDALSDAMLNQIAKNDRRNVSLKKTKVDAMLHSTRKILRELYYPFNVDLSLLLHDNKYLWDVDIEV